MKPFGVPATTTESSNLFGSVGAAPAPAGNPFGMASAGPAAAPLTRYELSLSGPSVPDLEDSLSTHPSITKSAAAAALTVENLARAQGFDGSFPSTEHHMRFLFSTSSSSTRIQTETLPASLAALSCAENVKKTLWSTILTLACLEKTFKSEKDAWEMLAEKATDFALGVLESECGLSVKDAQELLMELEKTAATYF